MLVIEPVFHLAHRAHSLVDIRVTREHEEGRIGTAVNWLSRRWCAGVCPYCPIGSRVVVIRFGYGVRRVCVRKKR